MVKCSWSTSILQRGEASSAQLATSSSRFNAHAQRSAAGMPQGDGALSFWLDPSFLSKATAAGAHSVLSGDMPLRLNAQPVPALTIAFDLSVEELRVWRKWIRCECPGVDPVKPIG